MKSGVLRLTLTLAASLTLVVNQYVAQHAQSQRPARYSRLTFSPYHHLRIGYESLPVRVVGARGGKLSANEKFKIEVSGLRNETPKNVTAVKFNCFIFNRKDLNKVLETEQTSLIPLDLPALDQRNFEIFILYVDDIPLLEYKPGEEFHLEVAVAEVHYDDGSIWQAKNLPGKLDLSKTN